MSLEEIDEIFFSRYKFINEIGVGYFSRVYEVIERISERIIALKVIALIPKPELNCVFELEAPKYQGINLVPIYLVNQTKNFISIIEDRLESDTILNFLEKRTIITESLIIKISKKIINGLKELKDQNKYHSNLHFENIFISEENDDFNVQLSDYLMENVLFDHDIYSTLITTEICTPPEIYTRFIEDEFKEQFDLYSFGIILFTILSGKRPFNEDEKYPLIMKKLSKNYSFLTEEWEHISPLAKDLINKLLEPDPKYRISLNDVLNHDWLNFSGSNQPLPLTSMNIQITSMGRKAFKLIGATKSSSIFKKLNNLLNKE